MASSLLGEAIIQPSDLSAAHRLRRQDVGKKEQEDELEKVLLVEDLKKEQALLVENLKKELKAKRRESYAWQIRMWSKVFELNKIDFARTMDEAWLTNQIIIERCRKQDPDLPHDLRSKAVAFNKQIDAAVALGLVGYMFGPSKKRKASSIEEEEKEASDEEVEELKDLKIFQEEAIQQMVEADREEFRRTCKTIYNFAKPFAKLKDREEYLSSVVKSLREREEREPVLPTVIEILGYMLLEELATSTRSAFHPFTPNAAILRNTWTLASIRRVQPPKIEVTVQPSFYSLFDQRSFEEKVKADYEFAMLKCNSDVEEMKRMIAKAEEWIETGKNSALEIYPNELNQMAVKRPFESQLVIYCEDLIDMRYGRCLNAFSDTENRKLKEIRDLARKAIDKYREAKGSESVPVITEPVLPSFQTGFI